MGISDERKLYSQTTPNRSAAVAALDFNVHNVKLIRKFETVDEAKNAHSSLPMGLNENSCRVPIINKTWN